MPPIKNYFSEENVNRRHQKNAAAIGRIEEAREKRVWESLARYARMEKRHVKSPRHKRILTGEEKMMVFNLYESGHSLKDIGVMMGMQESEVFTLLQLPLLLRVSGANDLYIKRSTGKNRKVMPKVDVILEELQEIGEPHERFLLTMQSKTGMHQSYLSRLLGEKEGPVLVTLAVEVCEFFGMCGDRLFEEVKEKAAE